jgi:hypothetical protein
MMTSKHTNLVSNRNYFASIFNKKNSFANQDSRIVIYITKLQGNM